MQNNGLIQETCGASAPAAADYNVGQIDRYGNVLPTIIISADQTIDWRARDYSDYFLTQLAAPNSTKEIAINNLCDSLVAADLLRLIIFLAPFLGENAADNSLNLAYPFSNHAKIKWFGSPTHGAGFVKGTGALGYGLMDVNSSQLGETSFGYFSLDSAITSLSIDMGIYGAGYSTGVGLWATNHAALGGIPSYQPTNYATKISAAIPNTSGLIMGHNSAARRAFSRNETILINSGVGGTLYSGPNDTFTICAGLDKLSTTRIGLAIVSAHLSNAQIATLSTIINQFITDKGAVII